MDEREVHNLLHRAAENVQPSPDLPDRAERRYRRRRARARALASAVVIAVVASGVAVAQMAGTDHRSSGVIAPSSTTTTPTSIAVPPAAGFLSAPAGTDVHELSVWGWNGNTVSTLQTNGAVECCNVTSMSPDGTRVLTPGDGNAPPEVLDVHGGSLGRLDANTGSVIWADDGQHLCELRPHDTEGPAFGGPADLVLIDPGHGERTVAQVPGYGPHTQPVWLRCSIGDDQALVADQFTTQTFSVTTVELTTGRTYTPKWVPGNQDASVVAISGSGRYVVESEFGSGLRYAIVDTSSGAVVGHVDGQAMQLSWDGHLVVELINGFDVAVVDWRNGAVLWRSANRNEVPGGPGGIVTNATVSARPESDDLALNVNDLPGRDPNVAQLWLVTPTTPPKLLENEVTAGII